jgi:hypothetical protein
MDRREADRRRRERNNREVVRKMKSGETMVPPLETSAFPPRPLIEKDREAMKRLYKTKVLELKKP